MGLGFLSTYGLHNKLSALYWIYKSNYSDSFLSELKEELTFYSKSNNYGFSSNNVIKYYEDNKEYLGIPRQYAINFEQEYLDLRLKDNYWIKKYYWNDNKKLYSSKDWDQLYFCNELIRNLRENGIGVTGKARPGFGKTVCGVYVSHQLQLRTLVIADKEYLLEQWKKAYLDFLGLSCGYVQRDKCDYKGRDVVLAMQDSLASRKYEDDFYKYFSVVIYDESHHVPADTYWNNVRLFPVFYNIGLTATPRSFDKKKNQLIFDSIGPIGAIGERVSEKVKVFRQMWYKNISRHQYEAWKNSPKISLAKLINCICGDRERNRKIAYDICKSLLSKRKVLILSDRISHLDELKDLTEYYLINYFSNDLGLNEQIDNYKKEGMSDRDIGKTLSGKTNIKCGWFTGEVPDLTKKSGTRILKDKERKIIGDECNALFATWTMAKEGLDIPSLDTLFLVTPRSDIEQAVGRIERVYKDKKEPYVIDYCDPNVDDLASFERRRLDFYNSHGFSVKDIMILPSEDQRWAIQKGY